MKISMFKRKGLAVFKDQGGAGTRIRRAGSSTTGIDRHAGPTNTLDQRDARGLGLPADGLRRPDGLRGPRDRISFKMFRYSQFKRRT